MHRIHFPIRLFAPGPMTDYDNLPLERSAIFMLMKANSRQLSRQESRANNVIGVFMFK